MDFLLVHGSTQSPRGYDRLAAALQRCGHRTVAVDLPRDRPGWTAARYADAARDQARGLTEPVRTLTPDWMRRAARDRLGTEPVEVPGGHCPHVSRPEQVAAILDR